MAKLEYKPLSDWQQFNFVGKRMYDFINDKINITTGRYVGDGATAREIKVDIIPRVIIIITDGDIPVIWMDQLTSFSKLFDGTSITDGVVSLSARKDAFIIGSNVTVNANGITYYYIVFGS
jgi:hypothetical protein